MELSALLHDTYEILRLKEDRMKMQWEDERIKYMNHIKILQKNNNKYKQLLISTQQDFRLLKKKVYDDKKNIDVMKGDKDINSINEKSNKKQKTSNKVVLNKSSNDVFDLNDIDISNLSNKIIKDCGNKMKTNDINNPNNDYNVNKQKEDNNHSSQTTCISSDENQVDNNINVSIDKNIDNSNTHNNALKIKGIQSTNYNGVNHNNMLDINTTSIKSLNNNVNYYNGVVMNPSKITKSVSNKTKNICYNERYVHQKSIQNNNTTVNNNYNDNNNNNNKSTTSKINSSNKNITNERNPSASTTSNISTTISNKNSNINNRKAIKCIELVRTKSARAALPGHACEECLKFYQAMQQQGVLNTSNNNNIDVQMNNLLQKCSRHKSKWTPPHTPEGYWDLSLDTPEKWKK